MSTRASSRAGFLSVWGTWKDRERTNANPGRPCASLGRIRESVDDELPDSYRATRPRVVAERTNLGKRGSMSAAERVLTVCDLSGATMADRSNVASSGYALARPITDR